MSAWWAPQSLKLLKGVKVFGRFDSCPPPLLLYKFSVYYKKMAEEKSLIDDIQHAPAGFKVSPGWRVGHLKEETITKSGLLVPAGSEKTSEALPLIDVDSGQQFWAVASAAWKFIWPPTGKVVLAVRESQIIAEEEISEASENGQLPIMK